MRPVHILPWLFATWCSLGSSTAQGQSTTADLHQEPVELVVRVRPPGSKRCFADDALQERIAHYSGSRADEARELRLELQVDGEETAELRIFRGEVLVSRRRFERLPPSCANRRDTVALSIALALEGAARELARTNEPAQIAPDNAAPYVPSDNGAGAEVSDPKVVAEEPRETERREERSEAELSREPDSEGAAAASKPSAAELAGSASQQRDTGEDTDEVADDGATADGPFVDLHLGGRWLAEALPTPVWTGVLGVELWLDQHVAFDLSAIASTLGNSTLAGARAQTSLVGGELFGCSAWKLGAFAAQGCLGATAAACEAQGQDYPVDLPSSTVLWAASAARVAVRWPEKRWISLRLVLQAHVNLVRPVLQVERSTEQLYPSWIGGSAGLDLLVSLE